MLVFLRTGCSDMTDCVWFCDCEISPWDMLLCKRLFFLDLSLMRPFLLMDASRDLVPVRDLPRLFKL